MNFLLFPEPCLFLDNKLRLSINIGTCNLWNVMFNWEVRAKYIADLVREADIDVLVFQEVRMTKSSISSQREKIQPTSQLRVFQSLLPEYKWTANFPASEASRPKDHLIKGWEKEGLGIISRKQIISVRAENLTTIDASPDKNQRIILNAKVVVGPTQRNVINICVVHLSYDRQQQCNNAIEILDKISREFHSTKTIILGDFNVYKDFAGPVDLLQFERSSSCSASKTSLMKGKFKDAWLSTGHSDIDGLTFSNMPQPGFESRPDRIFVPKNSSVKNVGVYGRGEDYKNDYFFAVVSHRTRKVLKSGYASLRGLSGYSCLHDCGPHGSCRCGVCVNGGNKLNCQIPDCFECAPNMFVKFVLTFIPFCAAFGILIYAIVKLLVISSKFSQEAIEDILGYRCCLFNKRLFHINSMPRRYRSFISKVLSIFHLPPMLLIILSCLTIVILVTAMKFIFSNSIDTIYSILPEEMHHSDHLLVQATVNF